MVQHEKSGKISKVDRTADSSTSARDGLGLGLDLGLRKRTDPLL